jgi:hypothetical protein
LYRVVCFKVQGTIREVFVVDDVEATSANRGVFMHRHAHDAEVALT